MAANPLDPNDCLFKICGNNKPVVIALDIENNPFARNYARSCIAPLYIRQLRRAMILMDNP
jgi:hypothetical protein